MTWYVDADSDGSDATLDCNDSDATVYPGATEVSDDGIDQDCGGVDTTTTTTTTVIMPAAVTSGETYTVRIRVTDDATGQYFTRDLDRVAIN